MLRSLLVCLTILGIGKVALATTTQPTTQPTTRPAYTPPSKDLAAVSHFVISYQGIMAPAAVHVQVVDAAGKPLALKSLTYLWTFGDPTDKYNQLPGWTAGHLYKKAGTYPITLMVSDKTGSRTWCTSVTIQPDTRPTQTVGTLAGFVPKDGYHYYLKGTLPVNNGLIFKASNVVYDSVPGTSAVVYCNAVDGSSAFNLDSGSHDVVFQNLTFDSPGVTAPDGTRSNKWMGWLHGTNITVNNCQFKTVMAAMQSAVDCKGLIILNNRQLNSKTIRGHFYWSEGAPVAPDSPYGSQLVELGNIGTGSVDENVDRMADLGAAFGLVFDNDMSRPDASKYPWTIRTADSIWFEKNKSSGAAWGVEPRIAERDVHNCVFANNTLTNSFFSVRVGVHDCVFRGNSVTIRGAAITVLFYNAQAPTMTTTKIVFADNNVYLQGRAVYSLFGPHPDPTQFVETGTVQH